MTVQLGDKAKDSVTGFEGVCVARTLPMRGRPDRDGPARLACWAALPEARRSKHANA